MDEPGEHGLVYPTAISKYINWNMPDQLFAKIPKAMIIDSSNFKPNTTLTNIISSNRLFSQYGLYLRATIPTRPCRRERPTSMGSESIVPNKIALHSLKNK